MNVFKRWTSGDEPAVIDLDLLVEEPADTYHSRRGEYMSSHALAEFRSNPPLFHMREQGLIADRDRPAYLVGRAAHTRILEGREAYEAEYAVGGPVNKRTGKPFGRDTKAFAEWCAAEGRPVLTVDDAALVERLDLAVRSHPLAPGFLDEGAPERVARVEIDGVPSQARFDWVHPTRGLVDLKTCDDLGTFGWQARAFNYLHQLAFYRTALRIATGVDADVHLIAVEKREPFRCGVWHVLPAVLDKAEQDNTEAIGRLKACRASNEWPSGFESIQTIDYL